MTDRPNFLFFMTDQHRSDWLGCMGHEVVKTPNLDALAAEGAVFDDFHVASPVCMPNRASLMTGRMPSLHGLRTNGCLLPRRHRTFVDVLAAAGYRTATIGKSHLQPFTEEDAIHAEDDKPRLIDEAWAAEPTDYLEESPSRYRDQPDYRVDTPYYGFQHVDMVTAHGDKCGGNYQSWFRANCPDWQALQDPANELAHNYSCPQAYRTPIPEAYYPTSYIAERAIAYLDAQKAGAAPFFAFVSFPDPHHPFNPPGRYWDMYDPDDFTLSLPFEAHQNPTPPMVWMDENWRAGGGQATKQTAMRVDKRHAQEAMALSAGMITMIDDQIGRVIAALKANGQFENTVICFNADHGDYLGDFSFLLKGAMPFRSITQVPMIWSDPADRRGQRIGDMASTLDLSASILDRAGLTPYHGIQGQSFLPRLAGGSSHRDDVLIEYNDGLARLGFKRPARVRALRNKNWRFTIYGGEDWGELYDLQKDPGETNNLWDSPEHCAIKAELSLRLNHLLTAQMDESPRATRLA